MNKWIGIGVVAVAMAIGAMLPASAQMNVPANAGVRMAALEANTNLLPVVQAANVAVSNRVTDIEAKDAAAALSATNTYVIESVTTTVVVIDGRIASWE